MDPLITTALVKEGSQLVNTAAQLAINPILQKQNFKWREKAAEADYNRQMQLYERQYHDKSPLNIVNQMQQAGLNPSMMFGSGGTVGGAASGSTTSSPSIPNAQMIPMQPLDIANLKKTLAEADLIRSQIPKTEAETDNIRTLTEAAKTNIQKTHAEIEKIGNENEAIKANTEYQKALTASQNIQNEIADKTKQIKIDTIAAEYHKLNMSISNLLADTNLKESQRETIEKTRSAQIEQILADTSAKWSQSGTSIQQTKMIREQTKFISGYYDNELRKTEQQGQQININQQQYDLALKRYATEKGWKTSDQNFQVFKAGVDTYFDLLGLAAKAAM